MTSFLNVKYVGPKRVFELTHSQLAVVIIPQTLRKDIGLRSGHYGLATMRRRRSSHGRAWPGSISQHLQ